jgi:hypothetical protein
VEDARALDELANDLTTNHVLSYHAFHSCFVHPIIQCGHAARTWQGRKPGAESWLLGHDFPNEHVGALRTATKTALPHQLRPVARVVRL